MSTQQGASDCGCCEGLVDRTPARIFNRPGLASIAYRAAAYGQFKQSMLAGLTSGERPALADLKSRAGDDLSIALIDAWAVTGDVLTFYIERTAQEHYLPTATERRSLDDLVQLINYRLRPGVAASTWLAFMLESTPPGANGAPPAPAPGAPQRVPIPANTRVDSLPGPDELPQTFETVEEIEALTGWNLLRPRLAAPVIPATGATRAWFAGVGIDLSPGDLLLFVAEDWNESSPADRRDLRRVSTITMNAPAQRTLVTWHGGLQHLDSDGGVPVNVFAMRQRASLFGYNAPDPRLFTAAVRRSLFQANPPLLTALNGDWAFDAATPNTIYLDAIYTTLEPDAWIVLNRAGATRTLARIKQVDEESMAKYGVSARVTHLTVDRLEAAINPFGAANTRKTSLLVDSQQRALADSPILDPVAEGTIQLASQVDPIEEPRTIAIRGKQAIGRRHEDHELTITADDGAVRLPAVDEPLLVLALDTDPEGSAGLHRWRLRTTDGFEGTAIDDPEALVYLPAQVDAPQVAEIARVVMVLQSPSGTSLALQKPLDNVYDRASTEIMGNVAPATHGESIRGEVLGSGDGSKPYQQFTLRKNPLTYVRGKTPGKAESTLSIYVNGMRWEEAPTLYGQGPRDHVYVTRITDDGKTIALFGNGEMGARLPSGQDNVVATYRAGTGLEGQVAAGQLSLLMTRPLGVRSVFNPLAPIGAADRQDAEDARENAPRSVLTLGRIVSLQDYEDFARDFPGVAKASAVWTWNGEQRGVLISVAGLNGDAIPEDGLVHSELMAAIAGSSPSRVSLRMKTYRPGQFRLRASLRIDPVHQPDIVLSAVKQALADRFSFKARALGEIVTLSDVYAAVHQVPGVLAMNIVHLYRGTDARIEPYLLADAPANGDAPETPGAELLTIDTASLDDLEILQ